MSARVTEYLIPDGFEILAADFPAAASVAAQVRKGILLEKGGGKE